MTESNLPAEYKALQDQWQAILEDIATTVGPTVFELWFEQLHPLSLESDILEVGIPNRFFINWISENYPTLIAASYLKLTGRNISVKWTLYDSDAKAHAAQVHEEVFDASSQQELRLSHLPTSMCRVSPFFPLSKKELNTRRQVDGLVIGAGSWGVLTYTGPQLSIYEEDTLLSVLGLIQKKKSPSYELICYGKEILGFCEQSDSKGNYERLKKGLDLMLNCKITLTRPANDKKKKRAIKWDSSNILSFVGGDDSTGKLKIVPNPYFYEMYLAKDYTLLDIKRRAKISGVIAKALYRFVMSHEYTKDPIPYNIETITKVLNLNEEQPLWRRRQQIETAIDELIKEKVLLKSSRLDRDTDKVWLIKHPIKSKIGYTEPKELLK